MTIERGTTGGRWLTGPRPLLIAVLVSAVELAIMPQTAPAHAASPSQWVKSFWPTAKSAGVSWNVYNAALGNFRPDPQVLEKANNQAEFNSKIWHYLDSTVTEKRIAEGRRLLTQHAAMLARIESRYGVDREVVMAIWGMESTFGAALTDPQIVRGTIRSLATLAYQGGKRSKYARQQLIAALKIAQRGDISLNGMVGSWAGAMGHTQFIPTTYEAYAVDFDGDGRRDIWNNLGDALGSTAHYLKKSGWRFGETWGYEVIVPKGFGYQSAARKGDLSLTAWRKAGLVRAGGKAFPRPGDKASFYAPAGADGPAFLLLKNFHVIKRYNNANAYALAVGHLADRLAGFDPFHKEWPDADQRLNDGERERLQRLLADRGYYDGEIDGNIGSGSRAAIMAYQETIGMDADGIGSQRLLQLLEAGR